MPIPGERQKTCNGRHLWILFFTKLMNLSFVIDAGILDQLLGSGVYEIWVADVVYNLENDCEKTRQ